VKGKCYPLRAEERGGKLRTGEPIIIRGGIRSKGRSGAPKGKKERKFKKGEGRGEIHAL